MGNLDLKNMKIKLKVSNVIKKLIYKPTASINPFGNDGRMVMSVDISKKKSQQRRRRSANDLIAIVKLKVTISFENS